MVTGHAIDVRAIINDSKFTDLQTGRLIYHVETEGEVVRSDTLNVLFEEMLPKTYDPHIIADGLAAEFYAADYGTPDLKEAHRVLSQLQGYDARRPGSEMLIVPPSLKGPKQGTTHNF